MDQDERKRDEELFVVDSRKHSHGPYRATTRSMFSASTEYMI